jgi:NAD(P)-dependent dehydrogenase (short-subunit alcohol dehydrogenase family)
MRIENSVALVTGANRGLGKAFVDVLLQQGVKKVYATARRPETVAAHDERIVPLRLDVTSLEDIEAVVAQCADVALLINNAGIHNRGVGILMPEAVSSAREEFETLVFAPLVLSQALVPALAANGGGAIINVLSALSWLSLPGTETYSAAKAAAWSLTNGLRQALRGQGTQVLGLHVGYMDTEMTRGLDVPKTSPLEVAQITLQALQQGEIEVLADQVSAQLKQGLSAGAYLQRG